MKFDIKVTEIFSKWSSRLKDPVARRAIAMRLARVRAGNLGDCKSIGDDVSEFRIFVGKGYRIYFTFHGKTVIILLSGGNKDTQQLDIAKAKLLAKELHGGKPND